MSQCHSTQQQWPWHNRSLSFYIFCLHHGPNAACQTSWHAVETTGVLGWGCGSKDQQLMVDKRGSGERMGPWEEAGRESTQTHVPCPASATCAQSWGNPSRVHISAFSKEGKQVPPKHPVIWWPVSPSALLQSKASPCCSNVSRGDMVACIPLGGGGHFGSSLPGKQ